MPDTAARAKVVWQVLPLPGSALGLDGDNPPIDDIRTAATDGSLRVETTEDNVYVLSGLADDFAFAQRRARVLE